VFIQHIYKLFIQNSAVLYVTCWLQQVLECIA